MTDREFRENTIDKLARVETQGQATSNRLTNVEKQVQLNSEEIQVVKADVQEVLTILEEREKRDAQEREERNQRENCRLTKTSIIASVITTVVYTLLRLLT